MIIIIIMVAAAAAVADVHEIHGIRFVSAQSFGMPYALCTMPYVVHIHSITVVCLCVGAHIPPKTVHIKFKIQ